MFLLNITPMLLMFLLNPPKWVVDISVEIWFGSTSTREKYGQKCGLRHFGVCCQGNLKS
jgi:hypothetical protein